MENNYKVTKKLVTISENKYGGSLELNMVSWNGKPERWDLRRWGKNENGERVPFKGVSMSDSEWELLKMIMEEY